MTEIITEKKYPLQKIWLIKSLYAPLLVTFVFLGIYIFHQQQGRFQNPYEGDAYLIASGIAFGLTLISFVPTALRRANLHYALEEKFLKLREGVIVKRERYLPYAKIQNVVVQQDPLDRLLGLALLRIENVAGGDTGMIPQGDLDFTPEFEPIGSWGNSVTLPGLKKEDAEALKGILLAKVKTAIEEGKEKSGL